MKNLAIRLHGVPPRLDLFITKQQRVVVYCPSLHDSYSETFSFHQTFSKSTATPLSKQLSKNSMAEQQANGKVVKFFPSDGHYEIDVQHDSYAPSSETYEQEFKIYGLVGILDLSFGKYLIYIKDRKWVAMNGDKNIFQVVSGGFVAIYREPYLTLAQEQFERESIDGVLDILKSGLLFYSYDYDLTNSSQKFFEKMEQLSGSEVEDVYLHTIANSEYWWNRYLQRSWISKAPDFKEFIIPLICGYVGHISTVVPFTAENNSSMVDEDIDLLLIARMRTKRAGTRYTRRGLDLLGDAAINVETELLLRSSTKIASFVQIRGSVPCLWFQTPENMKYKPDIIVESPNSPASQKAIEKHFEHLKMAYGPRITCFNLLDHLGFEKRLGEAYSEAISCLNKDNYDVNYHAFDLNPKFSVGVKDPITKAKTLKSIYEISRDEVSESGFFVASITLNQSTNILKRINAAAEGSVSDLTHDDNSSVILKIVSRQQGIFRTNCLDCLDRTNMVQFIIASNAVLRMMHEIGVVTVDTNASEFNLNSLESLIGRESVAMYREIWIHHGDNIATQYTGTGALHSNFIRFGTRGYYNPVHRGQVRRKIRDAILAITRFYLNQFADAYKQDSIDIFLGYHMGSMDNDNETSENNRHCRVSTIEFSKNQQSLQRQASFSLISSMFNRPSAKIGNAEHEGTMIYYIASSISAYLLLFIRYFAPKRVNSIFDYIYIMLILFIIGIWWILIGKHWKFNLIRTPKSGNRGWEGDETPIPSPLTTSVIVNSKKN